MEFNSYHSIKNLKKQKNINSKNEIWVCTEKIHGSNFSFITDGKNIEYARRTSVLKKGEKFHDYEEMTRRYSESIINIFLNLQLNEIPGLKLLRVFGEFYGGIYPGMKSKYRPIQKSIYYTPGIEFEMFDFQIEYVDADGNLNVEFYDYKKAVSYAEKFKIPFAHIMFEGNLEKMLNFVKKLGISENKFETEIYKKHGLPKLPKNIAEGVVIKLCASCKADKRDASIFKIKCPIFGEIAHTKGGSKLIMTQATLEDLWIIAKLYINRNRLEAVMSKLNEDEREIKILKTLLAEDAIKDFADLEILNWSKIDEQTRKELWNNLEKEAENLVVDYLNSQKFTNTEPAANTEPKAKPNKHVNFGTFFKFVIIILAFCIGFFIFMK